MNIEKGVMFMPELYCFKFDDGRYALSINIEESGMRILYTHSINHAAKVSSIRQAGEIAAAIGIWKAE